MQNDDKCNDWRLISKYKVQTYKCGLRAGQTLKLKKDLTCLDDLGRPTGDMYNKSSIWAVLPGAENDSDTIWLKDPAGNRHTWADSIDVFDWFEVFH